MTSKAHHETSVKERTQVNKATSSSPHLPASVSLSINSLANVENVSDEVDTLSRYSTTLCSRASMSQQSRLKRRNRTRSVAASSARATSMRSGYYHTNINYAIITLPWASTFFSPALWRREYEKLTNTVMRNTDNNNNSNDHATDDNRISITHDAQAGLNKVSAMRVACCVRALPDIHKLKLFFKRRRREAKLMPYEQWQQEHRSNTWHDNTRGDVHASTTYSLYNSSTTLHRNEVKSGNITRSDYEELAPLPTIWAANASTENDITVYDAFSGNRLMRIHNVKPNAAISTLVHAPFRGLVNKDLEILNVSSPDDLLQVKTKELINTDYVWVGFNDGSIRLFPANPRSFHESHHTSTAIRDNEATHIVYELPKFHNASVIAITRSPCHQDSSSETDLLTCNRYASIFSYATAATSCTTTTTSTTITEEDGEREEKEVNRESANALHRGKSKSKSKSIATITQKAREHLEIICTASVDSSIVIWDVHKIYRTIEVMRETQQAQQSEASTSNARAPFNMTSAAKTVTTTDALKKSVKLTNALYSSEMEHEIVTFDYFDRRSNVELTLRSRCTLVKVRPLMRLKGGVSALKTLHWVSTLITTRHDWNNDSRTAPENEVVRANVKDVNSYSVKTIEDDQKGESVQQPHERKQREIQELTRFMRREEHRKRVNLSMEQMREVEVEMNRLMPQCVAEPVQSLRVNLLIASDNIGTIHLWNLDEELSVKTNLETNAYEDYRNSSTREKSTQELQQEEQQHLFNQATTAGDNSTEISANTAARNSCVTFAPTAKTITTTSSKAAKTLQFSSLARRSISPAVQLNARERNTKSTLKQKTNANGVNAINGGNYNLSVSNATKERERNSVQISSNISETQHHNVTSDTDNVRQEVISATEANKCDENDNEVCNTVVKENEDNNFHERASHSNSPYRSTSSIPLHSQANAINVKYSSLNLSPSSKSPERGVMNKNRSTSMQKKTKTRSKPPESSPTLSPQQRSAQINLYDKANLSEKINHVDDKANNHSNYYNVDKNKSVQFVSAARMGKLQRLALQYQYDKKNQRNNINNNNNNNNITNSNSTTSMRLTSMQLFCSGAEMVSPFKDVKDFSPSKLQSGQRSPSRVNTTRSNRRSLSMLQTSREVSVKQGVDFGVSEEFVTPTTKPLAATTCEMQDNVKGSNNNNNNNYSAEVNKAKSSKRTAGLLKPSNAKQLPTGTKSVSMSRAANRQKSIAMKRGVSQAAATTNKSTINSTVNYDKNNQRATSMSVLPSMRVKQVHSHATSPSHLPLSSSSSSVFVSSHGQASNAVVAHEPQSFVKKLDRRASTSKLTASSHARANSTTPAKTKLNRTSNIVTSNTNANTPANRLNKLSTNGKISKMNVMPFHNDQVDDKADNTNKFENIVREESAQTRERMNELLSRTASCRLNFTGGVAINGMAICLPAVITTTMRRVAPTNETLDSLFQIPSPEQIEQRTLQNSFFVLDDDKALYLAFQQLQMYVAVEGTVLSLQCLPQWHGADCDGKYLFAERHNNNNKSSNTNECSKCEKSNTTKGNNPRRDDIQNDEETVIDGQVQMSSFAITLCKRYVELHSQPVANLLFDKRRRELWICRNDGYVSIFAADQKRVVSRLPHPTCTIALGAEDEVEWRRNQELLSKQLSDTTGSNDIGNIANNRRAHLRLELHRECENLPPSRFTQFVSFASRTESVMTLMLRRTIQSELWSAMSNMHVTFQDVNEKGDDDNNLVAADQSDQVQQIQIECDESSNNEEMCSLLSQTKPYVETSAKENNYIMNYVSHKEKSNDDIESDKLNASVTNERKVHEVHLLDGRSDLNIHSRHLEIHSHHKLVLLNECKERANMVHRAQQGHYEMLCSSIGKNARKLINKSEMLELWSTLRWYYDTWREHANRFHRKHISRVCKETRLEKCERVAKSFQNILRVALIRSCFASWWEYVMRKRMESIRNATERLLISYCSIEREPMHDQRDSNHLCFVLSRTRYLAEYYSCFNAFKQWKEFALAYRRLRTEVRHYGRHETGFINNNRRRSGLMHNAENAVNNLRFTVPKQKYSSLLGQKISKKALKSILHNTKQDVDLTSSFNSTNSANSILPLPEHSLPPMVSTFLDVVVDIFNARAAIIHFSDHCHSQSNVINDSSLSIIETAEANVEDSENALLKKVAVLQYGLLPLLQGLLVTAEDVLPNLHDPAVASEVITMFMSIHLCLDYILADAEELLTDIEEYELSSNNDDDDDDDNGDDVVVVVDNASNKLINDKADKERNASAIKNSNNIAYRMSMCRNRESVLNINKVFAQKQKRAADTYEMYRVKPSTLCKQLMQLLAAMVMDDEECVEAMEDVTMNLESFESFMAALTGD